MSVLLHQVRWEQRLFWRNREASIFVFAFPPLLFLLIAALYDGEIDDLPAADVLLAGLIAYGCANTAFGGLAITLVIRREYGLLKRLRATPLPKPTFLAAIVISTLLVFVAQMLVTIALGVVFYGAQGPERWLDLGLATLLGVAAFAGLGFGAASLIHSDEGASAVVNLIILPMAFLAGAFGPTDDYPEILQAIGDVLPLTYLVDIIENAFLYDESFWSDTTAIAVLVGWGAAGYAVAAWRFRWQPRERSA